MSDMISWWEAGIGSVTHEGKVYHMKPLPCPSCGKVTVEQPYVGWEVFCPCYDGAPDAPTQLHSWAFKKLDAIAIWNDQVEELIAQEGEAD